MSFFRRSLVLASLVGLTGCPPPTFQNDIRPIPVAAPATDLTVMRLAPIELSRITFNIPRGKQVGVNYNDFVSCGNIYTTGRLYWTTDRANAMTNGLADAFYNELSSAHFNVVGDPTKQFRTRDDRAEYLVGGQITDLQINVCDRALPMLGLTGTQRGEATMDVTWQVFSNAEQRIVLTTKTRGYGKLDEAVADGERAVIQNAFAAAAANLAGDKGLVDLLRRDQLERQASAVPVADATLSIPRVPLFAEPFTRNAGLVRLAAVTILLGNSGHGSGFFITNQGHILTNQHVVGNADTVPVRLSNGTTIMGRVLRRHPVRDVALVKIDAVDTRPVAVRMQPVEIAEEVYAIGTPVDRALSATVTRGIVSAVRRLAESGGQPQIQADVTIHSGNSGGPLVDARGNVVGISVAGVADSPGLNFFIPIEDALEKLKIQIGP